MFIPPVSTTRCLQGQKILALRGSIIGILFDANRLWFLAANSRVEQDLILQGRRAISRLANAELFSLAISVHLQIASGAKDTTSTAPSINGHLRTIIAMVPRNQRVSSLVEDEQNPRVAFIILFAALDAVQNPFWGF
jgi:hypothetical protein